LIRTQTLVSDARRNVRLYTTIKDRKSPLKGSRPSVPHGTNYYYYYYYPQSTRLNRARYWSQSRGRSRVVRL